LLRRLLYFRRRQLFFAAAPPLRRRLLLADAPAFAALIRHYAIRLPNIARLFFAAILIADY